MRDCLFVLLYCIVHILCIYVYFRRFKWLSRHPVVDHINYKSLIRLAVMICASLVIRHTHRQLLTGYAISSAS